MSGLWPAFSVVTMVSLAGTAVAQHVCVECREPERTYRCTVKDGERVQHIRGANHAFEFVCISEIARTGGHKSCRVGSSYAGPCIGQAFEVDVSRAGAEQVVVGRPPAAGAEESAEAAGQPKAAAAPAKQPPETLEQLARETVAKSKEQMAAADEKMRKAGDAVGDAVKRTWGCLASLFSKC